MSEKSLILPQGPEYAPIMFILDSGTEDESRMGFAFSGNNERQFKSLCKGAGIKYEETYRTMYLKQKLNYDGPKKKLRDAAVAEAKIEKDYDKILLDEILSHKPRVIVPLGELSLQFIAGEKSVAKFRGSQLPLREDHKEIALRENYIPKIIPTLSPKFFFVDPRARVYVSIDLEKILNATSNGPSSEPILWIADSLEKFNNFLDRYREVELGVFDIETKINIPVCIGFCFSEHEAICVPLVDSHVDNINALMLWKAVDNLLRAKKWVNQNIKFDIQKLTRFGFEIPPENVIGDTALRSNILFPEFPKNLAFLNSIYTDLPYYKDEGKEAKDRRQLYLYCAKDCLSTRRVYFEQTKELEEAKLVNFEKEVNKLFWPYVRMEARGIRIDEQRLRQLIIKYHFEYGMHKSILERRTYKGFNPHSSDQVSTLIYKEYELPEQRNRKTESPKTDEETLELLVNKYCKDDPYKRMVLKLIIGCRKLHKVIEYCDTLIHPDNRLRGSWDLGGTNTGRSSCKSTTDYKFFWDRKDRKWKFGDCGRSIQTISKHGFKLFGEWFGKDLRSIFVPSPGFIFVEGDLAAAEARVDAVLSEDFDILKTYDIPPGIHIKTGEWIFGYTLDKKKEPDKYHIAKTIRHAGERNMGPDRCMMLLAPFGDYSKEFCVEALTKFHNSQPNIQKVFHAEVCNFVQYHQHLISPHGRRREFYGDPTNETFNEAISTLPQATVSDQLKFSIPMIEEQMPDIRLLAENHDGLLAEVKPDEVEKFAEVFSAVTSRGIDFRNCSLSRDFILSIPCEISCGESWDQMKELK